MQKLLITGSSGFLGSRIAEYYKGKYEIITPTHRELDITDEAGVIGRLREYQPDFVIHCAAVSDVGACERDPENSYIINVEGSKNVAKASAEIGAKCLMCSSDQVYFEDGGSDHAKTTDLEGHTEEEKLFPANVYGREKRKAEEECLKINPDCVMLRLSWMYDTRTLKQTEHGDFIRTLMQKLETDGPISYPVHDMRGITDVNEVVINLERAFQLDGGVYNFGAPNDKSTYETAFLLLTKLGLDVTRLEKNEEAFAGESRNLCMSQRKIKANGIQFSTTLDGLVKNLRTIRETMCMNIRRAEERDMEGINKLLCQVLMVHHNGRPDLFKSNAKKYTDQELKDIIRDDTRPIFVGVDEKENVMGYAFCIFQQHINNNILTDVKSLYIDDLCVDEKMRGQHIGKQLYEYVLDYAKGSGCYNVTLNVWACNESARKFYEKCGLIPQKIGMEKIL